MNVHIQVHTTCDVWIVTYEPHRFVDIIIVILRKSLCEEVLKQNEERQFYKNLKALDSHVD